MFNLLVTVLGWTLGLIFGAGIMAGIVIGTLFMYTWPLPLSAVRRVKKVLGN